MLHLFGRSALIMVTGLGNIKRKSFTSISNKRNNMSNHNKDNNTNNLKKNTVVEAAYNINYILGETPLCIYNICEEEIYP